MDENKETVEKFTRAIYKAQKWVDSHSAKEIAEAIKGYFDNTELDIIEMVVDRYKKQGSFATDPILDQEEWENLQNIMEEAGELPKRIDYEILVDTKFAESVMKK